FNTNRLLQRIYDCNASKHTKIYSLSLHAALPIFPLVLRDGLVVPEALLAGDPAALWIDGGDRRAREVDRVLVERPEIRAQALDEDRKSTRLNSSHVKNSYAVFCLKKKIK